MKFTFRYRDWCYSLDKCYKFWLCQGHVYYESDIYIINHNSFSISNLSIAIYGWSSFELIQRLRFNLRFLFFSQNYHFLLLKKCGTHINSYPMDKKLLKIDICFIHWIIFLVGSHQKIKAHISFSLIFLYLIIFFLFDQFFILF